MSNLTEVSREIMPDKERSKDEILELFKKYDVPFNEDSIKLIELLETERRIKFVSKDNKTYVQKGEIIHKRGLFNRFFTLNQDFLLYIVKCKLNGTQRRVLDMIMAYMEKDNLSTITASEIANFTGIKQPHVCTSIKKLIECKIIFDYTDHTRKRKYGVNYNVNKNLGVKCRQTDEKYLQYHKDQMKTEERVDIPTRHERQAQLPFKEK